MNKLYNNLTIIKNSFSGIRESFINNFGINYKNKPIAEYPNMLTDLITSMFPAKTGKTSLTQMFKFSDIKKAPPIDTQYVKDFSHMFYGTYLLKETRVYDMTSAENLQFMYAGSSVSSITFGTFGDSLVDFTRCFNYADYLTSIEGLKTAKAKTLNRTFGECTALKNVTLPDMSECESIYKMLQNCTSLVTVEGFAPTAKLKGNGGIDAFFGCIHLKNIVVPDGSEICISLDFSDCPFLTRESMISILNALSPNVSGKILYLGSAKQFLSNEEIAIATGKGWAVL